MDKDIFIDIDHETFMETAGLEDLPNKERFECVNCGFKWRQVYIPGQTDI